MCQGSPSNLMGMAVAHVRCVRCSDGSLALIGDLAACTAQHTSQGSEGGLARRTDLQSGTRQRPTCLIVMPVAVNWGERLCLQVLG